MTGVATGTKPYFVRALHEWCSDNGFTPYLSVRIDEQVQVPKQYEHNQQLVLNIGLEATQNLVLGNDNIHFRARFNGVTAAIVIPMSHVLGIFSKENGQGMGFPPEPLESSGVMVETVEAIKPKPQRKRTHLRIVK